MRIWITLIGLALLVGCATKKPKLPPATASLITPQLVEPEIISIQYANIAGPWEQLYVLNGAFFQTNFNDIMTNRASGGQSNRRITVAWRSLAGRSYVVESSTTHGETVALARGWSGEPWTINSFPISGNGGTNIWTSGVQGEEERFFRVREFP
jgi:hypothetical protein